MTETKISEPQQPLQRFNESILKWRKVIGLIFITASLLSIVQLWLTHDEILYSKLIITVLLFLGGLALLRTESSDVSPKMAGESTGTGTTIFSVQSILLGITIFNVVLFVGGSIFANLKVNSIQEKYDEAIETVNQTEIKYKGVAAKLEGIEIEIQKKVDEGIASIKQVLKQVVPLEDDIRDSKNRLVKLNGALGDLEEISGKLKLMATQEDPKNINNPKSEYSNQTDLIKTEPQAGLMGGAGKTNLSNGSIDLKILLFVVVCVLILVILIMIWTKNKKSSEQTGPADASPAGEQIAPGAD